MHFANSLLFCLLLVLLLPPTYASTPLGRTKPSLPPYQPYVRFVRSRYNGSIADIEQKARVFTLICESPLFFVINFLLYKKKHKSMGKRTEGSMFAIFIFVAPNIFKPRAQTISEPTAEISTIDIAKNSCSPLAHRVISP